jgi:hypothetical protein
MFLNRNQDANGDLQGLLLDDICKPPILRARTVATIVGMQRTTAILHTFQFYNQKKCPI